MFFGRNKVKNENYLLVKHYVLCAFTYVDVVVGGGMGCADRLQIEIVSAEPQKEGEYAIKMCLFPEANCKCKEKLFVFKFRAAAGGVDCSRAHS